ncbi:MAG TPA: hypothetical protein VLN74_14210 [Ilumatobacteraceae bacterium]|nr:hypothetical protein [Ilumatobacteraceae bacterium]
MRRSALVAAIALALATGAACEDDGTDRQTVEGFVEGGASGTVEVEGFLLIDGDRARLCAAIAESYPPQCGGASVELSDLDPTAFADVLTTEGDVSWLDGAVLLLEPDATGGATFVAVVDP